MTKELEEAKARLSAVLRDHERNPQAGTLYLIAADLRTLLSALSRGDGTTSHDRTTVEYAVREAVVEAANLGREGYDIPKAEAIVTEALRVIWNIAAAPPVPEGEE